MPKYLIIYYPEDQFYEDVVASFEKLNGILGEETFSVQREEPQKNIEAKIRELAEQFGPQSMEVLVRYADKEQSKEVTAEFYR